MLIVAAYVLGLAVLRFLTRRWIALVLPPIAWSLGGFGEDQGWWGSGSGDPHWLAMAIPISILSMLVMTVGILLGQIHAERRSRIVGETTDTRA